MKKLIIIAGILILMGFIVGIGYYFTKQPLSERDLLQNKIAHSPCLGDDEIADFPINEYYGGERFKYPKFPVVIYVRDKNTNKEKFHFQIDNVRENYYPIEIRKCGVYVIRQFNYDSQKTKKGLAQDPGYREGFWRYDYGGKGESFFLFHEKTISGEYKSYYATDFRVDPREIYIALESGYPGSNNEALVIRNLNNQVNSFTLLRQNLYEKYPRLAGYFGLEAWTKDGSYFWGDLKEAANEIAFLRILRDTWNIDVFPVPEGVLGGSALNIEKGYVTLHPDYLWVGIQEHYEQIKKEWQEEGKISSLYLYNLLTEEQTFLATISEPLWFFDPIWLSDTELQYELPTGEKGIYKIKENKY